MNDNTVYISSRPSAEREDLLFMILNSDVRTKRALMLLWPLAFMVVTITGMLVLWAVLQPENALYVGAILVGTVFVPLLVITAPRRVIRKRRMVRRH